MKWAGLLLIGFGGYFITQKGHAASGAVTRPLQVYPAFSYAGSYEPIEHTPPNLQPLANYTYVPGVQSMSDQQQSSQPRGIRNNNPGNIEDTGASWQGLDKPRNDGRYLRFIEPEWGIRAMARVLANYQKLHGINTVQGIISRWAPESENKTGAYIQHVASKLGVTPTQPIDVQVFMPELIKAIILHENGVQPYSEQTIEEGIAWSK